jgi:hypothetical protein
LNLTNVGMAMNFQGWKSTKIAIISVSRKSVMYEH